MAEVMPEGLAPTTDQERGLADERNARVVQALAGVLWQGFPRPAIPNRMLRELCSSMLANTAEAPVPLVVAEAAGPVAEGELPLQT